MNIKSMLIKLAEEQADKMQEEAMKHLGSDEMTEKIYWMKVSDEYNETCLILLIKIITGMW